MLRFLASKQLTTFTITSLAVGFLTIAFMSTVFPSPAAGWQNYPTARYWNDTTLDWLADEDDLDGALVSGAKAQITPALSQWDSLYTDSDMDLTQIAVSGDIDIVPYDFTFPEPEWGGPGNTTTTGHTPITYAVAWLDTNFTWFTDGTMDQNNQKADVKTITLHEIGHTLGWKHRDDVLDNCDNSGTGEGKVLYSSPMCIDWTEEDYTNDDDRAGMRDKY